MGNRKGGGLAIYVNVCFDSEILNVNVSAKQHSRDMEIMWVLCRRSDISFVVCACYHPPNPKYDAADFIRTLSDELEYVFDNQRIDFIVVAGDFNSLDTQFLCHEYGFSQLSNAPTHCNKIIDKFFINRPDLYRCEVTQSLVKTKHKSVIYTPTHRYNDGAHRQQRRRKCRVYDLRAQHIDFLRYTLGTTDWSVIYDMITVDSMYSAFLEIVKSAINLCIPSKIVSIRESEPYYITPLVKSLLCKRNRLRRKGRHVEANLLAAKLMQLLPSFNAIICER